ncbi:hypothetical protein [Sphingomonas phage Kimi]|nr:hypothetical protein [Sphingomonas phage Kimi]
MSSANYDKALPLVLAHEGGFVDHPKDPGGPTNKGVTQRVYDAYRTNIGLAKRSVRLIETGEVRQIYRDQYWNLVSADQLPEGLDYAVFDYAVNSGVGKAVKDLQRELGVGVDGVVGELTIRAAKGVNDLEDLIVRYCNRRLSFLRSLKTWATFGKGWKRRVDGDFDGFKEGDRGVLDYSILMVRNAGPAVRSEPVPLPAAIGTKTGEENGKGLGSDQAITKTPEGIGAVVAGIGVSGQTVIAAAEQVKPHINDTFIGKLALAGFVILMLAGVGLLVFNFLERRKERAA